MKRVIVILGLMAHHFAFAGGFQLNVQGVKAVGLGGAFTGLSTDASSVFFNPGAMSLLSGHHIMGGVHLVTPSVSLQTAVNYNIDQTTGNANPMHFYYVGQVNDKINVGFLVNNQFGSSSSFEDDWQGRFIVQNISLKTFMFQPTASYKLHEKVSIGAGFVYTMGSFSYAKGVPVSSETIEYGQANLSGKGNGYGFNVGVYSKLLEKENYTLSLGVDYRSKIKIDLPDGTVEFSNIPVSLKDKFPESTNFKSELNLPSVFTAGFAFKYTKAENFDYTFVYDFNYTGWSSYDTLAFDFENADTPDSKTPKNWKNVPTHRLGIEVMYKQKLAVRGGLYIDKTPIEDGYVSPELPDADQTAYTAGLGYKINDHFEVDLSYIRQNSEREASLDNEGFSAIYRRKVNVYGISVHYNFTCNKKTSQSSIE